MHELTLRISGFFASLALTLASYFIITDTGLFDLNVNTAAVIIVVLALFQSIIQLVFFIDVWKEKGALWNAGVFISTASIIFIVIYFSIWIMNHLNYHMH